MKIAIVIVIVYLVISVFIGIAKIMINDSIYRGIADVPTGDLEFYDTSELSFGVVNYIFFPSIIVYYAWVGIISAINFIIDLF